MRVRPGTGQTNLWMPQGALGQVIVGGEQGYLVRWEFPYSSWTLFTCEVEMLLHVVSTAGRRQSSAPYSPVKVAPEGFTFFSSAVFLFFFSNVVLPLCLCVLTCLPPPPTPDVMAHCARVKPILDLVHKIISTDWTVSDCLLPLTSRIYMLLQRCLERARVPLRRAWFKLSQLDGRN